MLKPHSPSPASKKRGGRNAALVLGVYFAQLPKGQGAVSEGDLMHVPVVDGVVCPSYGKMLPASACTACDGYRGNKERAIVCGGTRRRPNGSAFRSPR
jgi:hypothetical protein